jgi:hypothetical protein
VTINDACQIVQQGKHNKANNNVSRVSLKGTNIVPQRRLSNRWRQPGFTYRYRTKKLFSLVLLKTVKNEKTCQFQYKIHFLKFGDKNERFSGLSDGFSSLSIDFFGLSIIF